MKKKTIYLKRFKAVPKEGTHYSLCYDEYRNECYWSTGPKEGKEKA